MMEKLMEVYPEEGSEPMDVGWDWNSPQAKPRPQSRLKRRPQAPSSPRIPMKRHPSREYFDRIREELKALREDMARPEDEESLRLSPMQEEEFKNCEGFEEEFKNCEGFEEAFEPFDDFFDDELDKQLFECTKQIEEKLLKGNGEASSVTQERERVPEGLACTTFDDMIQKLHKEKVNKEKVFKFKSENFATTRKVEFPRTQSFDESMGMLPKSKLEEIDRKKKEALAKLESKKKTSVVTSPLSISTEEIEKKRLQALARREAKRQEEIIERKRQEALKRLESNRMKYVNPLANRLN